MYFKNKLRTKVIFLDHDGVMVLNQKDFEPLAVQNLNDIIKQTNCEICVSSAWRRHYPFKHLQHMYLSSGIIKPPFGYTPTNLSFIDDNPEFRARDIKGWLSFHDPISWVVVDDMDLGPYIKNFVKCNPDIGLTDESLKEKIINKLCK